MTMRSSSTPVREVATGRRSPLALPTDTLTVVELSSTSLIDFLLNAATGVALASLEVTVALSRPSLILAPGLWSTRLNVLSTQLASASGWLTNSVTSAEPPENVTVAVVALPSLLGVCETWPPTPCTAIVRLPPELSVGSGPPTCRVTDCSAVPNPPANPVLVTFMRPAGLAVVVAPSVNSTVGRSSSTLAVPVGGGSCADAIPGDAASSTAAARAVSR